MLMIAQYRGKSLFSKLVMAFNWGDYSHSAVLNLNTGEIIEAWRNGVRKATIEDHKHKPGTVVDLYAIVPNIDHQKFWDDLSKELGKGYDFLGLFGFLVRKHTEHDNKWFCSELVFNKLAPQVLLLNCDSYKVGPSHLSWSPLLKYTRTVTLV